MNKKHFYAAVILLLFLSIGTKTTRAINIPGDDSYYDVEGSTYTLNQDVSETIQITADEITLDGAGHTVDGTGSGFSVGVNNSSKNYVTIKNLNVTGFPYGIWLADSSNNTVTGNTVNGNVNAGIWLQVSSDNTLSNNTVSNNSGYGISLGVETYYNDIYNNTVSNNGTVGIYLCNNAQYNTIFNNNFENTTNASVIGVGNVFDLGDPKTGGKGGNYWSNWMTPDDDGDGIVDDPYVMPPYEYGQDNYPWVAPDGWLTPPTPQALIVQLIDTVAEMNLQQGIDNSLDAKLDAALNALDDVNQNNDVAAINSLNAFINAVEAQRDNKLTDVQADELIAKANGIIAMLSG